MNDPSEKRSQNAVVISLLIVAGVMLLFVSVTGVYEYWNSMDGPSRHVETD